MTQAISCRSQRHRRAPVECLTGTAPHPVDAGAVAGVTGQDAGGQIPVQRQLAALLEQLPVVLAVIGGDGWITSISGSPLMEGVRGSPRPHCDATCPMHLDELFPDDDPARPVALSIYRQALRGVPATGRYQWRKRWWEARGVPAYEGGEITGVLMVVLDITAQVRAEAARVAAEERFRVFMDRSPASVAIQDEDGRYVYVNDAARRAYGIPAGVVDFLPGDVFPSHVATAITGMHRDLMASGGAQFGRWEIPLPHGSTVISGYRFCFVDAEGTRYEGNIGLDETETTRQRAELTAWRDRHRTLFDRNPVPMIITTAGAGGTILDANPAFGALVGGRLSDIRGRGLADFVDPVDDVGASVAAQELIAGKRSQINGTTCYRRHDGTRIRARVTLLPVPGTEKHHADDPGAGGSLVNVIQPEATLPAPRGPALTRREATILELRARGNTNPQIATAVGLSTRGLDYHLRQLARKLRCPTSPAALVARAFHLGLLGTDEWPPRAVPVHPAMSGLRPDIHLRTCAPVPA